MVNFELLLQVSCLSVALAAGLSWAIRLPSRGWALWLLALGPVALTYALNSDHRVHAWHGFLHLSIVYQITEVGIPPMNPLLAGEPVRYTWGPHVLIALLSRGLRLPPAWTFAAVNLAALALTLLLLYRTAMRLCGERRAAVFGVVLALFGFGFIRFVRDFVLPLPVPDVVGIPPVMKFAQLNIMPLGILAFAAFLYAVSGILSERTRPRGAYLLLFVSIAGAGLLYPIHWLGILVGGAAATLVLVVRYGPPLRARAIGAALVATLGAVCIVPYLLRVSLAAESEAGPVMLGSLAHVLVYASSYGILVLPLLVLLVYGRVEIGHAFRGRQPLFWALAAVSAANALLYAAVSGPVSPGIEYKFRTLSFIPLGLVAGLAVEKLRQRSVVAVFLVLSLLLFGAAHALHKRATRRGFIDDYVEDGVALRHADPLEDELYRWISTRTSPHAGFVDTHLTIPVFGRRALFVGLDWRREQFARRHASDAPPREFRDGWGLRAEERLAPVLGSAPEEFERRRRAARAVLSGEGLDAAGEELERALRESRIDELYVVVREGRPAPWLEADRRFTQAFGNPGAVVFRFQPEGSQAASKDVG